MKAILKKLNNLKNCHGNKTVFIEALEGFSSLKKSSSGPDLPVLLFTENVFNNFNFSTVTLSNVIYFRNGRHESTKGETE